MIPCRNTPAFATAKLERNSQYQISSDPTVSKRALLETGSPPLLKIAGTNFRDGVTVHVDSVPHTASKVTSTSLEVALTANEAAAATVEVVVVNRDGTKSAPMTI